MRGAGERGCGVLVREDVECWCRERMRSAGERGCGVLVREDAECW